MTDHDRDLAIRLTSGIVATDGVQGIYPQSVVAAAVALFVGSDRSSTGIVQIDRRPECLDITARLAIDSTRPSLDVAAAVAETVRGHLNGEPFHLHIEIAHLTEGAALPLRAR